ncbi:MAG: alpha/beta hydrolase family protein [Mycobacteriales bacterium]
MSLAALCLAVATASAALGAPATDGANPRRHAVTDRQDSVSTSWLHLVDHHRWTVSHGHVLAHERRLRTMLLRPTAPGAHPLVVFCHGYDSNPEAYLALLRHWAAKGFIVAAPYFPLTRKGAGRWLDENDVAHQPGDVSVVITGVIRTLGPEVQSDHIVVAGHSDGGSTAFMVGFQRHDADPRVSAIMAFSADRWGRAKEFKAPRGRLPLLLVQSNRDQSNSPRDARVVWDIAKPPKMYLHLNGASHGAPFMTASPWRPIVEAVTTDFLRAWTTTKVAAQSADLRDADRDGTRPNLSFVTDRRS